MALDTQPHWASDTSSKQPTKLVFCAVDGDPVPVPHWGMALRVDQFHALAERVRAGGISFEIEPHLRFKGAHQPHRQVLVTGSA